MAVAKNIKKNLESPLFTYDSFFTNSTDSDALIDLSVDYPDSEPPAEFNSILKELIDKPSAGMHRYMENSGYTYLRTYVADLLSSETGKKFTLNDVIMTCGSSGAFNMVFKALLNPGEEVIVLQPYIKEYEYYVENHSGLCVSVPCTSDFMPDFAVLEKKFSTKTRALVVNSPNNPSGKIYSEEVLKRISEIVDRKSAENKSRIYIVSDEVYSKYCYSYEKCPRIGDYYPHTIFIYSYSQELGLPSERIGYMAVNPDCEDARDVMAGLVYASRVLGYINAPALMQNAIYKFGKYNLSLADITNKKNRLMSDLKNLGYTVVEPEGGYYLLVKSPDTDDIAFVAELKKNGILALPGTIFKAPGYFRLSYCVNEKKLEAAVKCLSAVANK